MAAGTYFSKTYGPTFLYFNHYAGPAADPVATVAQSLWDDAKAQAQAEQGVWPYAWFSHPGLYPQEAGRGTVSGTFAINDSQNPSASPGGMWIGLAPADGGNDFQLQARTYQFWVRTAADGTFSIPHVLPGTYNLWAFGPGAAGTFEQANVSVAAGANALGTLTWAPTRVGPTVWEIGVPDRDSKEFNDGEKAVHTLPAYTQWGTSFNFATAYPGGLQYTVGSSHWATDWNYCQPAGYNAATAAFSGGTTSKILFNLATAPSAAQAGRLYLAFADDYSCAVIVSINGVVNTANVTVSSGGATSSIASPGTGFFPPCSADAIIRLGSQGDWADASIPIKGSQLKAGLNEIDITSRPSGTAGAAQGFEYDYLRLELSGYSAGTPTPTRTPGAPSPSASASASSTRSATPSPSGTSTATATATPSPSRTLSASPSASPTGAASLTVSPVATRTPSPAASATLSPVATASPSPAVSLTASPAATRTPSPSASSTQSPVASLTSSPAATATLSPVASLTASSAATATFSPAASATASPIATAIATVVVTATVSPMASATPSSLVTPSASSTPSPAESLTPSESVTGTPSTLASASPSPSATDSSSPSATASATRSPTPTLTTTGTASSTVTGTPSRTATASATPSPAISASPSPSATAALSASPSLTQAPTASPRPTAALSPSATPTLAAAGSGGLRILGSAPAPDPSPKAILVDLSAPASAIQVRLWSVAWTLLATVDGPSGGPGWVSVPLPASVMASLPAGTYYYSVTAQQGQRQAVRALGRFVMLP
jgi:hypothetical protein